MSKLKALESEKRRAQRLASFGALASGIAHEIKNPLVAIRTFAELLPERFNEVDFREDFSKVVIAEIDRIDGLVSRLRGIAAPGPPVAGPVDIREPIADTLTLLRAQLEHTHTNVRREFDDAAPYVAVDDAQLKQLFLNLFINAIEAMGPGGELTIRLNRRDRQGASWVIAEVSDTGPGIPESIRAYIFDPFFTTKARGSGLGLAICRGITDAHRGTIRAETRDTGRGTNIAVEFPAASLSSELIEQKAAVG
jgi:two-component system nitrogen regulation sensor histidine kinase GlnL